MQNVRFTIVPYNGDTAAICAIEMDTFLLRSANCDSGRKQEDVQRICCRAAQGVLVSKNFAARWRLKAGNRVHLDTPTGPLDLPIVGMVEDYRSDKGTIFMDRALYKRYWKDDAVDFVDITLKPGQDAIAVKHEIERMTAGSEHALVYTNVEFRDWIGSLVDKFFMLNYMQLVVAVIVAVVGIANTLVISVAERRREFGIIRAIGGYQSTDSKDGAAGGVFDFDCGRACGCDGGAVQHTIFVADCVDGAGRVRRAVLLSMAAGSGDIPGGGCGVVAGRVDSRAPRDEGAGD